jgi:NitT/TauT family transport system ATP-binding protein
MPPAVEVRGASKVFTVNERRRTEGFLAVQDVDLRFEPGEFVCFIGPSGCGKTTVLNMISGAIKPTEGEVRVHGDLVTELQVGMGYVTQDDTLLGWRTLERNVSLGLELGRRRRNGSGNPDRVQELIDKVGLSGFERHYPHQLSGGMQKRAALIRTLVTDPDVILMDEPFGAVDAQTRLYLQDELLKLWEESRNTIAFVTHDLVEAITLADRIVCFARNPGRVRTIIDVPLERPRNVFRIHESPGYDELYATLSRFVHEQ